jgi:DNA-binding NtrC family response regulator
MKILLVEDDEATQEMITRVLKRLGRNIDIDAAANGDDALTRYLESFHDVVITDHAHPGKRGIELIELILERRPLQPVILQTGNYDEHIEAFRQKHKDIPFLQKPYPLQQLQDIVRAVNEGNV